MDNLIYVIYRSNDQNYYIDDKENNCIYKFQTYNDIIDTRPYPKRFQLHNCEIGNRSAQYIGKVEIYERITNSVQRESKVMNSYCWKSNVNIGEGSFTQLNTATLESIWTKMEWLET